MTKELAAKAAPARESKIARVIALLKRKQGATLVEMIETTGWLPHTTVQRRRASRRRATLSNAPGATM